VVLGSCAGWVGVRGMLGLLGWVAGKVGGQR
jgi:hypothetical protein